ncbi:hypothetical protein L6R52_27330 [Myxococcota bacterium]|nr:hypothetical protein [Myxococcota bacterium]
MPGHSHVDSAGETHGLSCYDWLDNLSKPSADRIIPELQAISVLLFWIIYAIVAKPVR